MTIKAMRDLIGIGQANEQSAVILANIFFKNPDLSKRVESELDHWKRLKLNVQKENPVIVSDNWVFLYEIAHKRDVSPASRNLLKHF